MKLATALPIAATVVVLDQLSKLAITLALPLGASRSVIPGLFRLVHTRNRGIAFGLFPSAGQGFQLVLLIAIAAIVVAVAWQLARTSENALARFGLALVLGGAVGNVIDRLAHGEVVDFLCFFVVAGGREHQWPSFNVADAAITIGAGCLILAELLLTRRAHAPRPH
jgi:signal peptidase II